MRQRLTTYDGQGLRGESIEVEGRLRWACRNRKDDSLLLVGDRGTILKSTPQGFAKVESGISENLRCAEYSPSGEVAYACGNRGRVIKIHGDAVEPMSEDLRENLRRLAWNPSGSTILVVGNNGAAFVSSSSRLERVLGAETHLRSIAWHPRGDYALVTGNCFHESAGGLSPSPNLFRFQGGLLEEVAGISESRADLTAATWNPAGSSCLITGYDQTWHTPVLLAYEGGSLRDIAWVGANVYPTACAWHPSGGYALIASCAMSDSDKTAIYSYDGEKVAWLADLEGGGVSCISWSRQGSALIVASRSMRAFSV